MRILLQKGLTVGVRFPTPGYAAHASSRSEAVAEALSAAAEAARETLEARPAAPPVGASGRLFS